MKQPTQPIAVRRSPVFVPGQGWVYTPGATMATSPPNVATAAVGVTVHGVSVGASGGDTTGVSISALNQISPTNNFYVTFSGLPNVTVPAGYYATIVPSVLSVVASNMNDQFGYGAFCAVWAPTITIQAFVNGGWTPITPVTAGFTASGWRLQISAYMECVGYVTNIHGSGPFTVNATVQASAILVTYPA